MKHTCRLPKMSRYSMIFLESDQFEHVPVSSLQMHIALSHIIYMI